MTYQFDDDSVLEDLLNEQLNKRKTQSNAKSPAPPSKQPTQFSTPSEPRYIDPVSQRYIGSAGPAKSASQTTGSTSGNSAKLVRFPDDVINQKPSQTSATNPIIPKMATNFPGDVALFQTRYQDDGQAGRGPVTSNQKSWSDMKTSMTGRSASANAGTQRFSGQNFEKPPPTTAMSISDGLSMSETSVGQSSRRGSASYQQSSQQQDHHVGTITVNDVQMMSKQELINLVRQLKEQLSLADKEQQQSEQIIKRLNEKYESELNFFRESHETRHKLSEETYKNNLDRMESKYRIEISQLELKCENLERKLISLQSDSDKQRQTIEMQYEEHLAKMDTNHKRQMEILVEQHQHNLMRLDNFKQQELRSVIAIRDNGADLDKLLNDWSDKIQKVSALYDKELERREHLLSKQLKSLVDNNEQLAKMAQNLDDKNHATIDRQQRYMDLAEQHKELYANLIRLSIDLEERMKVMDREKEELKRETIRQQDSINKEKTYLESQINIFGSKIAALDEQKEVINGKMQMLQDREERLKADLDSFQKEVTTERQKLKEKENGLATSLSEIQSHQKELTREEVRLKRLKEELNQRSSKINKAKINLEAKGQELRQQNLEAMKIRTEASNTLDEAERMKIEIDTRESRLVKIMRDIESNKMKYSLLYKTSNEEIQQLQRLKQSLICSLCSSRLFSNQPAANSQEISLLARPDLLEKPIQQRQQEK